MLANANVELEIMGVVNKFLETYKKRDIDGTFKRLCSRQ